MKILFVNNFFTDYGGAENSQNETAAVFKENGHEVFFFATDKKPYFIEEYEFSRYFPQYIDYSKLSAFESLKYFSRPLYNTEAELKLSLYLKEIKPDIVHCNCIAFHLTPSVVNACYKENIPVVMTIRDPRLMCPGGTFMKGGETYCKDELCIKGNPIYCLIYKCKDRSLKRTLIATIEAFVRKIDKIYDKVSLFICPSQAVLDLSARSGIPKEKLVIINNFISDSLLKNKPDYKNKGYFLYVGRLSKEKGIFTLLETFKSIPEIKLHIVGTGSDEDLLKDYARKSGLLNVKFSGYKTGKELKEEYRNCIATILPSNWFEIFGLAIIESFACGKPVIASNTGGIPEIVDNEVNGFLVEPDNITELSGTIKKLYNNSELVTKMGIQARQKAEARYSAQTYYSRLITIYNQLIKK